MQVPGIIREKPGRHRLNRPGPTGTSEMGAGVLRLPSIGFCILGLRRIGSFSFARLREQGPP